MRACLFACVCVPCKYTFIANVEHIKLCDYTEGHLCGDFCDGMMYAMSIYKQAIIYGFPKNSRWRSTARNDGIIRSPLGKYFVLDVLEMHFPLYR